MELYFQAAKVDQSEWAVVAATNLDGLAALWLQQAAVNADWTTMAWDAFK